MIFKDLPDCPLDRRTTYKCPRCFHKGMWRSGAEFEGQKRCLNDDCGYVWAPGSLEYELYYKAVDQMSLDGAGI